LPGGQLKKKRKKGGKKKETDGRAVNKEGKRGEKGEKEAPSWNTTSPPKLKKKRGEGRDVEYFPLWGKEGKKDRNDPPFFLFLPKKGEKKKKRKEKKRTQVPTPIFDLLLHGKKKEKKKKKKKKGRKGRKERDHLNLFLVSPAPKGKREREKGGGRRDVETCV